MKKSITIIICVFVLLVACRAQQQTPQLLKQPANWQFERFTLPPQFAPGVPYKGAEELRFSPGMFTKDSVDYFTYAFVAELDNTSSISEYDIKTYLLNYFKGLCGSTAKQRSLSVDTSKITVDIKNQKSTEGNLFYNTTLHIFGVFADGAPVTLNMEIKVMKDKTASKAYLVFIASPLDKSNKIWTELHSIQNSFTMP